MDVTVTSISSVAPVRLSLSLGFSLTLLDGPLAKTPDSAANEGRTSPWVDCNARTPGEAGFSLTLLDGPLAKTPDCSADERWTSPWVDCNTRTPGEAGFSICWPLSDAATVAGRLESQAVSTGPAVLAVVAQTGVGHSGGDEASDDLKPIQLIRWRPWLWALSDMAFYIDSENIALAS